MDNIDEDLYEVYADQMTTTLDHLVKNKTLDEKSKGMFLQSMGSELFKLGFALKAKISSDNLDDHSLMVIPDSFVDETKGFLTLLQTIAMDKMLTEKLKAAKNENDRDDIRNAFKKATKMAEHCMEGAT